MGRLVLPLFKINYESDDLLFDFFDCHGCNDNVRWNLGIVTINLTI